MKHMIFDAHLHIVDQDFPVESNNGYLPDPFTVDDYVGRTADLGIAGGAVVAGSFQSYDQQYLLTALRDLGPGFVGVTQVKPTISDKELFQLSDGGVRAVRFNLRRGGFDCVDYMADFAWRIFDLLGWHIEIYADSKSLAEIESMLRTLPAVSIDHLGLSKEGLPMLYRLAESGIRVKATGFGRVDFAVSQAIKRLYDINPDALMFGTDLPSTRSPRPFHSVDIEIIGNALGDSNAKRVLWDNAAAFYKLAV
ncbi:putative TIM-barrel fold metal-dependent hydrolase [Spongiibacter sp. IMCC21906]|jgi:predicted TIM-barrel fold metal-dependent hydrolase|uniref:amidohydrolase family protein n=1 Tax=Spongiibacter sp. IMCC21906 TaxID=1620392 RepID=UPI00062DECC6|nr:amidohydrolase family protein [Spongiibacter sp. IMCC21906]AKH70128.1 putative TIM-barrel fold metal-dependent hydrolase [Spongiibacter sp. IMCC21906]